MVKISSVSNFFKRENMFGFGSKKGKKDSSNKELYNLIGTFMESWAVAISMDSMLAKSEEPIIDTPEYFAIVYGAIDCCGQSLGVDEENTILTASVFFHNKDKTSGIEYLQNIFDTSKIPELQNWVIESGQAVKDLIGGAKESGQVLIPLAEKYRIAVSNKETPIKGEYESEFKDDKLHGQGTYTWPNGNVYEGNWKEGNRDGKGILFYADGNIYEGDWENDFIHGQGTLIQPNGDKFEGEFMEGEIWNGVEYNKDGNFINKWVNGEKK